jgi:transposase
MDMHRPYLSAARSVLPDAVPVVDKFHVQRGANELLTEYRRRLPREVISDPARRGLKGRQVGVPEAPG